MAELTPLPTAQRPSDGGYQPVSGFAVAAMVAAGVFVLFLLVVILSALSSQRTAMAYELLILPAVGVGLSIAARSHLKSSEGTRSGAKLAATAWWTCVLGGAGFFAYLLANEYFVQRESKSYADKFLEQLQADKPYHAFVFLVDPSQRETVTPEDPQAVETQFAQAYGQFRNHDLLRIMRRNPGSIKIEHAGAVDVGQEADGFKAMHIYRMETPEGVFDVRIALRAAESKGNSKPVWRIVSRPTIAITVKPEKLSQYGRLLFDLEAEAANMARVWSEPRNMRQTLRSHLFTLPGEQREKYETALRHLNFLGGPSSGLWSFNPAILPTGRREAREASFNGSAAVAGGAIISQTVPWSAFDDLLETGFFGKPDGTTPFTPDQLLKLRHLWKNPMLSISNPERPLPPNIMPSDVTRIYFENDRIRVVVPIDWMTNDAKNFYKAALTLVCEEPEVINKLADLRKQGVAAEADLKDARSPLADIAPRRWRMSSLRTDLEVISPQLQTNAAMPPKGGP